ncbi:hypothetical protein Glove_362g74 [Diversispora epigaea]|uniref:Uncharacterized protein n=1 Tax=Diversispora epigaea TaxID=1348612 RepID=A0A397HAD0_9GLOM|nr:hypothetical protein Glove_362g74 [Diversispora epigaea]
MLKKLSLNDAIKIAESHRGKCLSIEYINNITPMFWECNKFHQWTTQFYNIKNKHSWYPHCVSKKLKKHNISVARELALAKNGRYISENYFNNKSSLSWECKNNHQFHLSLADVKNSKCWCRECKKLSPEFAQNLANKKGGKCIASSYCNRRSPLSWSCSKEQLCREIVTKYPGLPSKIRQPDFLKTLKYPTGLHLDIYYPQGDPDNFIKQQARDQLKEELLDRINEDPYIVIPEHLRELGLIE